MGTSCAPRRCPTLKHTSSANPKPEGRGLVLGRGTEMLSSRPTAQRLHAGVSMKQLFTNARSLGEAPEPTFSRKKLYENKPRYRRGQRC